MSQIKKQLKKQMTEIVISDNVKIKQEIKQKKQFARERREKEVEPISSESEKEEEPEGIEEILEKKINEELEELQRNKQAEAEELILLYKKYTNEQINQLKQPIQQEIISNQMNWLDLEAKSRRIVQQLLNPIIKKSYDDREAIYENRKQIGMNQQRIDKLEKFVFQERHIRKERDEEILKLQDILEKLKQEEQERIELKLEEEQERLQKQQKMNSKKEESILDNSSIIKRKQTFSHKNETKSDRGLNKKFASFSKVISEEIKESENESESSKSLKQSLNSQQISDLINESKFKLNFTKDEKKLMDVHEKLNDKVKEKIKFLRSLKHHTKIDEFDFKLDEMRAFIFTYQKDIESRYDQLKEKTISQDFLLQTQNDKIDLLSKQQNKVEEQFQNIQEFVNKQVVSLSEKIAKFQFDVQQTLQNNQKEIDNNLRETFSLDKSLKEFVQINEKFSQQQNDLRVLIDTCNNNFDVFKPTVVLRKDFEQSNREIIQSIVKLGNENLAQQFEINTLNNFLDKYLPLRLQHQISLQMRQTFKKCQKVEQLHDAYEEVEATVFSELHQILFMDNGKADLIETIRKMNINIAQAERKLKMQHDINSDSRQNEQKTIDLLEVNQEKRNVVDIDYSVKKLHHIQDHQKISRSMLPKINFNLQNEIRQSTNITTKILNKPSIDHQTPKNSKQNKTLILQQVSKKDLEKIEENPENLNLFTKEESDEFVNQNSEDSLKNQKLKSQVIKLASEEDKIQVKYRAIQKAITNRQESFKNESSSIKNISQPSIKSPAHQNYETQNTPRQNYSPQAVPRAQQSLNSKSTLEDQPESQILNDENLASNIEKLMNPNKKKEDKIVLDKRFEDMELLIMKNHYSIEQSISSRLEIFSEKMREMQIQGIQKINFQNKELRVYIQELQNQFERIETQNKIKLEDFLKKKQLSYAQIEQNEAFYKKEKVQNLKIQNMIACLKSICESLVQLLEVNLLGKNAEFSNNDSNQVSVQDDIYSKKSRSIVNFQQEKTGQHFFSKRLNQFQKVKQQTQTKNSFRLSDKFNEDEKNKTSDKNIFNFSKINNFECLKIVNFQQQEILSPQYAFQKKQIQSMNNFGNKKSLNNGTMTQRSQDINKIQINQNFLKINLQKQKEKINENKLIKFGNGQDITSENFQDLLQTQKLNDNNQIKRHQIKLREKKINILKKNEGSHCQSLIQLPANSSIGQNQNSLHHLNLNSLAHSNSTQHNTLESSKILNETDELHETSMILQSDSQIKINKQFKQQDQIPEKIPQFQMTELKQPKYQEIYENIEAEKLIGFENELQINGKGMNEKSVLKINSCTSPMSNLQQSEDTALKGIYVQNQNIYDQLAIKQDNIDVQTLDSGSSKKDGQSTNIQQNCISIYQNLLKNCRFMIDIIQKQQDGLMKEQDFSLINNNKD